MPSISDPRGTSPFDPERVRIIVGDPDPDGTGYIDPHPNGDPIEPASSVREFIRLAHSQPASPIRLAHSDAVTYIWNDFGPDPDADPDADGGVPVA